MAINSAQYGSAADTCGMCVLVTASSIDGGTPFTAFVDNKCPECHTGDLDIGTSGNGRFDISWHAVECPVGSNYITYFYEGTNTWYLKMQAVGSRFPLAKLEVWVGNSWKAATLTPYRTLTLPLTLIGTWKVASHTDDNFWVATSFSSAVSLNSALRVRLTAVNGQVLEDEVQAVSTQNDVEVQGNGVQFPSSTSSGSESGVDNEDWAGTLVGTTFWDCNGMGCDAALLQPWDESRYVGTPQSPQRQS